jgi:hypothetical protein
VLLALAEERDGTPDLKPWHDLQRWLELGERRVTIPYAQVLAEAIPPVAVRLRRDFGGVLGLIRAHALLHQETRERDERRRIVATIEDYIVIRELIGDLVSEGVEALVKPEIREAVGAVEVLHRDGGVPRKQVAEFLHLDPSAAGRRLKKAEAGGFVRNLESTRGKPACRFRHRTFRGQAARRGLDGALAAPSTA